MIPPTSWPGVGVMKSTVGPVLSTSKIVRASRVTPRWLVASARKLMGPSSGGMNRTGSSARTMPV